MSIALDLLGKVALGFGSTAAGLTAAWWVNTHLAKKALNDGELTDEILVVSNVIEFIDGVPYLKPRTVRYERPIGNYFHNKALAKMIVAAAKRADADDPLSQLIRLPDDRQQGRLMKRVVNIASELGAPGHIVRMFAGLFDKNDAFVCFNYAQAGEDDWIIRIDVISARDLERFRDPQFIDSLDYRKEEGSHLDNARIFQICANKQFGGKDGEATPDTRLYVRRVSIPTLKTITIEEVKEMLANVLKRGKVDA